MYGYNNDKRADSNNWLQYLTVSGGSRLKKDHLRGETGHKPHMSAVFPRQNSTLVHKHHGMDGPIVMGHLRNCDTHLPVITKHCMLSEEPNNAVSVFAYNKTGQNHIKVKVSKIESVSHQITSSEPQCTFCN